MTEYPCGIACGAQNDGECARSEFTHTLLEQFLDGEISGKELQTLIRAEAKRLHLCQKPEELQNALDVIEEKTAIR